ncbi:MAG: hypothetical protein KDA25_10245, partial [Phycisphaerales bacterium]|nr:hypothetical protein [Phycisphaerales bacterium]
RDLAKRIATMQAAGAGDDANALKAQLHEVVADYIEQSLRVRTLELLMFEKKVHTVREDLQRDAKNADRLVRELYERLLAAGPNTGAETTPAR